jgi:hypothetical protein
MYNRYNRQNVSYSCCGANSPSRPGVPPEARAMSDRVCPLAFVGATAFASALVWLYTMMHHLPLR